MLPKLTPTQQGLLALSAAPPREGTPAALTIAAGELEELAALGFLELYEEGGRITLAVTAAGRCYVLAIARH